MSVGSVLPCPKSNSWPNWGHKPVFLIGGGPSAARYQLSELHKYGYVVGCNNSWQVTGCCAVVSADKNWIRHNLDALARWPHLAFMASEDHKLPPNVIGFERVRATTGLSEQRDRMVFGGNSGYVALNVAYLAGAREIYLLGYDLNPSMGGHWHNSYPWHNQSNNRYYIGWARQFDSTRKQLDDAGIKVYNLSLKSGVEAFPKIEKLEWLRADI